MKREYECLDPLRNLKGFRLKIKSKGSHSAKKGNSDLAGVWRRFTMHLSLASGGHIFFANLFSCDVN